MAASGVGPIHRPARALAILAIVVFASFASMPPQARAHHFGDVSPFDPALSQPGSLGWSLRHGGGTPAPAARLPTASDGMGNAMLTRGPPGGPAWAHPDVPRASALVVTLHVDPRDVTIGQNAYLHAVVSGGSPPLYFTWYNLPQASFLPTGCSPRNAPIVFCEPASPGVYNITVVVTDALGVQATATGSLQVFAPGLVVSISGTPIPSAPGQRVELNVTVSGGVGPYRFHWTGLPAGCVGSTYVVDCSPRFAGAFPVNVTVQDYSGETATSNLTIVVVSPKVLAPLVPSVGAAGPGIYVAGLVAAILVVAGIWWASKYRVPGPWRARSPIVGSSPPASPSSG
jgi:hypothetical protein